MDAHDELFYRLNDPGPNTQVMAELDLLYKIFGGAVARLERLRGRAAGVACGSPARRRERPDAL